MTILLKGINIFFIEQNKIKTLSKSVKYITPSILLIEGVMNIEQDDIKEIEELANNDINGLINKLEKQGCVFTEEEIKSSNLNINSSYSILNIEDISFLSLNIFYSKVNLKQVNNINLNCYTSTIFAQNNQKMNIYSIESDLHLKNINKINLYAIESDIFRSNCPNTLDVIIDSIIKEEVKDD